MDYLTHNLQPIIGAAVLLALLVVAVIVWRRVSPRVTGRRGQRLGVSEYHEVDKSRRLVLVRRDNVEHLVLIGGGSDVLIESGITPASVSSAYVPPNMAQDAGPRTVQRAPFFERKPGGTRNTDPNAPLRPRDDPEF